MARQKKKIILAICFFSMLFLMAGCGKGGVPREKDIIRDLQETELNQLIRGDRHIEMEIDSLKIDEQRGDDKEMVIYCITDMHNEDVKVTLYYELHYIYSGKDGWVLEDCMEWKNGEYIPLDGVDVQEAIAELENEYESYIEVEFAAEETDLEAGKAQLTFNIRRTWDNCIETGQITVEYDFKKGFWKRGDMASETISVDFSPLVGKSYKSEIEGIEVNFIAMDEENRTVTLEYLNLYDENATWQQKTVRYVVVDNTMYIERVYYESGFDTWRHYAGVELWVSQYGTIENHCLLLYSDDTDKGVSGEMIEQYY